MSNLFVEGSIIGHLTFWSYPGKKEHEFSSNGNAQFLDSTILSVLTLIKKKLRTFVTLAAAPGEATAAIRALLRRPNSYLQPSVEVG